MCDELARLGYVAVAPDMFNGQSTAYVPRAIWLAWNAALRPGARYNPLSATFQCMQTHTRPVCETLTKPYPPAWLAAGARRP
jgi:dienelactone hydrolase